jgi:transposase InsO family protein
MRYIATWKDFGITSDIAEKLKKVSLAAILPVNEFHSDKGSEFINYATERRHKGAGVPFTRSRSRRKNDYCFVEQKNGAVVRSKKVKPGAASKRLRFTTSPRARSSGL